MHRLYEMTEPELRGLTNKVCQAITKELPPDTGFAVIFFPTGEPGISQYGSNCSRKEMIEGLYEAAERLRRKQDVTR